VTVAVDGALVVSGNIEESATITIADISSASLVEFTSPDSPGQFFAGDLILESGIPLDVDFFIRQPTTSDAAIDFSGQDIAGLFHMEGGGSAVISDIDAISGRFWPAAGTGSVFSGSASIGSVPYNGLIWIEDGRLDGVLNIVGDVRHRSVPRGRVRAVLHDRLRAVLRIVRRQLDLR
jgi:hypothetical protein